MAILAKLPQEDAWFREESVKHFYGFTDQIWAGLDDYERARKRIFYREHNLRKSLSEWATRTHYDNKKK